MGNLVLIKRQKESKGDKFMKKLFSILLVILMLIGMLVSCNVDNTDTNTNTNTNTSSDIDTSTQTDTNTDTSTDTSTDTAIDTSIQVEYDAERESSDNEFPFDNIVVERNGYDIVSAGKYYGSDFDNVKYYGSYYRIIDNYEDFSKLTQWGNQLDETIFDENFIFVLYSYSNCSVYYSHPTFNDLNGLGEFAYFKMDMNSDKLSIFEIWSLDIRLPDKDNYTPLDYNYYKVVVPKEAHEIIYLIIPKNELPNSMHINGEVKLIKGISKAE